MQTKRIVIDVPVETWAALKYQANKVEGRIWTHWLAEFLGRAAAEYSSKEGQNEVASN